jgi:hypothetical protein
MGRCKQRLRVTEEGHTPSQVQEDLEAGLALTTVQEGRLVFAPEADEKLDEVIVSGREAEDTEVAVGESPKSPNAANDLRQDRAWANRRPVYP